MEEVETMPCEIEKIIELSSHEFMSLLRSPLKDQDFIKESIGLMGMDKDGVYHCLLAIGEGCDDGLIIQAEGYGYARYSAFVSNARQIINSQSQYQSIKNLEKSLSDAVDEIISSAGGYDGDGPYRMLISELAEKHSFDESYAPLLIKMLNECGQIGTVEYELSGEEIFAHKTVPVAQYDPIPFEPERMKKLLDRALNWIGEMSTGPDLNDTLKNTIGMTDDEIAAAGFDIFEKRFDGQDENEAHSMKME